MCILLVLTNGVQTASLTESQKSKLKVYQHVIERSVLSIRRIRLVTLRSKTAIIDVDNKPRNCSVIERAMSAACRAISGQKFLKEWVPQDGRLGRSRKRWTYGLEPGLDLRYATGRLRLVTETGGTRKRRHFPCSGH